MTAISPFADGVCSDHLIKVASAGLHIHIVTLFSFLLSILWRGTLKLGKYVIPHQTFNFFKKIFFSIEV